MAAFRRTVRHGVGPVDGRWYARPHCMGGYRMLVGLYIFVDDDFDDVIYKDPNPEDLDEGLWEAICVTTNEAVEGDTEPDGHKAWGEYHIGWKFISRVGLTFVAVVTDDVRVQSVDAYLRDLSRRYLDEVDDAREPEREGVADVVVDVIPAWEEEDR